MIVPASILSRSRVLVIGCGALGNEVLKNLVLMGVGELVVVDFDRVEASNLTRSVLFRLSDVGRRKVDVVRERLLELNPGLRVEALAVDAEHDLGLGWIKDSHLVISCVDSRWTRFMINRNCLRLGKHWIDGGITFTEGTVRVFGPASGPESGNCYACNLGPQGQEELRRRMPCPNAIRRAEEAGHVPTSIITASVIGAVMAQEAVKFLSGEQTLKGRIFSYDADTAQGRVARLEGWDDECLEHDALQSLDSVVEDNSRTVRETLEEVGPFVLRDDVFVDWVCTRAGDARYTLMCPGRMAQQRLDEIPQLRGVLLSQIYAHEYRVIDHSFPYGELKLSQLGIPQRDILIKDGI